MKEHPTEKEEISAYHIPGKGWISKVHELYIHNKTQSKHEQKN